MNGREKFLQGLREIQAEITFHLQFKKLDGKIVPPHGLLGILAATGVGEDSIQMLYIAPSFPSDDIDLTASCSSVFGLRTEADRFKFTVYSGDFGIQVYHKKDSAFANRMASEALNDSAEFSYDEIVRMGLVS